MVSCFYLYEGMSLMKQDFQMKLSLLVSVEIYMTPFYGRRSPQPVNLPMELKQNKTGKMKWNHNES